ncbi:hypothetical protein D3C77_608720 [compost metagenome]
MEITESLEWLALPTHHKDCQSAFLMLEKKTMSKQDTFLDILGSDTALPKKSIVGDVAMVTSGSFSEQNVLIALLSLASTRAVKIFSP